VAAGLLLASFAAAGKAAAENSLADRLIIRQQADSRPASDAVVLTFQVTMGEAIKRSGVGATVVAAEANDGGVSSVAPAAGETSR
jgi:hypothetical protein